MDPYVQVINSAELGEGPHWDGTKQELLYVDIYGKAGVHKFVPSTGEHTKVDLPDMGGISLVVTVEGEPDKYIVSTGRDLQIMEWDGKTTTPTSLTKMLSVEPSIPSNRFNDGKCDTLGRLWAGTMAEGDQPLANFYKINAGAITNMQSSVTISNGIAWNSANTLMYYIDTPTGKVDVFDYNHLGGSISNRRTVYNFQTTGEAGSPDGMTIDSNGNLLVGCWGGHQMIHVDPVTGQKIRSIPFPTANITSAAFGGPNLDILYVTSATSGLSSIDLYEQPAAGSLFQVTNLGIKGQSAGNPYKLTPGIKKQLGLE